MYLFINEDMTHSRSSTITDDDRTSIKEDYLMVYRFNIKTNKFEYLDKDGSSWMPV